MTHTQPLAASELSECGNADLLSEYIIITAQLRDGDRHRRLLLDCRAAVRDTIITRIGLGLALRFCTKVDGLMR